MRIFGGVFGEQPNHQRSGFDTGPGAFPPGSQIGFDILDARRWDGSDFR